MKVEAFLPVAAPASVIPDRKNEYYRTPEDLQQAIGDAMHTEYRTIIDSGLLVQLDDARAAVSYDRMVPPRSKTTGPGSRGRSRSSTTPSRGCRASASAITSAGSWPGPHSSDVPFKDIADLVLKVRAGAYSIELANPRHEHEWRLWEHLKLPKDTVLIPGVISHATNIVEHPELVAERIVRLARLVGRENVIAGTDCGFAQVTISRACTRRSCGPSSRHWCRAPISPAEAVAAQAGSRRTRGPSCRDETTDREAVGRTAECAVAHRRALPDRKLRNTSPRFDAMLRASCLCDQCNRSPTNRFASSTARAPRSS